MVPMIKYRYVVKESSVGQSTTIAVRKVPTNQVFFPRYDDGAEYVLVIQSALENAIRTQGEALLSGSKESVKNFVSFSSTHLKEQFKTAFEDLCDLNDRKIMKEYTDWERHLTNGLGMINIWDIGFSKVAAIVIPVLAGHLTNSFVWTFLDLMRDVDNLYDPPELFGADQRNDDQFLMKWRARIHYLLRLAKLADPGNTRSKVCHIVASVTTSDITENDIISKIQQLKEKVEIAAKQMQVNRLINSQTIPVFKELDDKCIEEIKNLFIKIINQQLQNLQEIPLSYIFLRCSFYGKDLHVTKKELRDTSKELGLSNEQVDEFCRIFASFGTVIDLSSFDKSYDRIILKVVPFLNNLDKLFYFDADRLVSQCGVLTLPTAKEIFGKDDAIVYIEFLQAVKLAIELPAANFNIPSLNDPFAYYIPTVSNLPPKLNCSPTSLHWLHDLTKPLSNLTVLFVAAYLKLYPTSRLELSLDQPLSVNFIPIKSFPTSAPNGVLFYFVYLGNLIEFRFPHGDVNKEVCQQILKTCKQVLCNEAVKYNFALMCRDDAEMGNDDRVPCSLQRELHLLPMITGCGMCSSFTAPLTEIWNDLLKQDEYKVPEGRKLHGEPLTRDELISTCDKIIHLSKDAIDALANALRSPDGSMTVQVRSDQLSRWGDIMQMILDWERGQRGCQRVMKDWLNILKTLLKNPKLSDDDHKIIKEIIDILHA
jgi:hypothetical protein